MKTPFTVTGMSCAACSARVEHCVQALHGVGSVQVNLLTHSMQVEWDEGVLSAADICAAVAAAGYGAAPAAETGVRAADEVAPVRRRFLCSLVFLLPLTVVCHTLHGAAGTTLQVLLLLPILWLNGKLFLNGGKALLHAAPNMNTLIALGALAGILYSAVDVALLHTGELYLESAGMILTFISLGKWLEARATGQTGQALAALRALLPQTARVQRGEAWVTVNAAAVQAGDVLQVRAGERIPADAVVETGVSAIDESVLTGESLPAEKTAGSPVYAGTVNGHGVLVLRVRAASADSALSGIIRMVGDAAASKAPIARAADRVSSFFVPAVAGVAVVTAAAWLCCGATWGFALGAAIAVLVISCPCALGLATPVAMMTGAGKGAENGILFRNGAALELARRTTAVLLDKTGTITEGRPAVADVLPAEGVSRTELLSLAAVLEGQSHHPLAAAVRRAAGAAAEAATELHYLPGLGVTGTVGGVPCAAGNAALMQEQGIACDAAAAETLAAQGKTPLFFSRGGQYLGLIAVSDAVKKTSAAAVAALQQAGLRVLMVTGDAPLTAAAVAQRVGITEVHAGARPQDKAAVVARLQREGHVVTVIGDGINDTPALAQADVGMAIGAGTEAARETADIVLVRSDLQDALAAFRLSRAVLRTIRQNLFWAFFYNVAAIPLAAGAWYPLLGWRLNPAVAAAAMSLSSLCVVGNALRLRSVSLHQETNTTMKTMLLNVEGMMCPHCEKHVTDALAALPHVVSCKADHTNNIVTLETSAPVEEALLRETISKLGYTYNGQR